MQFIIGADNGSALTDGDDQQTVFVNRYGQGMTLPRFGVNPTPERRRSICKATMEPRPIF